MSVKVEKLEKNAVKLEITVSAEKFNEALNKSYKKNAKKFNIPGFRKGKAPMNVIIQYYGEGVLYDDAINFACEASYPAAIEENKIEPVDYPEIDVVSIGKGEDLVYTATVTVKPEVKLGDYKGVEVNKVEYKVTEEDVEAEVNSMREKAARMVSKEDGEVNEGDIAVIDFEGFVDDTAFEGGKGENFELTIGSGTFIPGFEDQLKGTKAGESKDVNVTFPEDYRVEELAGKPALFKVTVNEIKVKEVPELDDEFVKDVSEFDTVDELKADIKKKLEEANEEKAKREFEDAVIKKITDASEVEVPDVMIEREVDFMVKDLDMKLKYQGLDINKYMELLGMTMDKLRSDFREVSANRVKTNLVVTAIAKAENLEVTEEELLNRAEEIAKRYGEKDLEKMRDIILTAERESIKEEISNNKVVDLIVENSKAI
ncbi:trigger factor [Clostridium cylindrosporum]|uniref:Trigger factor n=1 Tax=Clostridium cylindrosporum DSM 605 TaxID=1121307 RepID=A0A0J8D9M8_CLOCY|nr:trigger factor [Clostridium cylindrosporum]KMT22760.1 trigger factor Tig [Clostridium cylindrosporum DSM 605]